MTEPTSPAANAGLRTVPGIRVGHFTDLEHGTGCTVLLADEPAVAGIDIRGGAPGVRDTALLDPLATLDRVNGILLTGGSVFGLAAADGVTQFLADQGQGIRFGNRVIPLCPAAVIFDLGLITDQHTPDAQSGYQACVDATEGEFAVGSVGAGTGAAVGSLRGARSRTKGGLGAATVHLPHDLLVSAVMVVNAVGDVVDPKSGVTLAGPRRQGEPLGFHNSTDLLLRGGARRIREGRHTVIGVVLTNAKIDKVGASILAAGGQDGIVLAVRPAHTRYDGDTVFALSTCNGPALDLDSLRAAATTAVVDAILCAIRHATGLGGIPSASEFLANGGAP